MHVQRIFHAGKAAREQFLQGTIDESLESELFLALEEEKRAPNVFSKSMVEMNDNIKQNTIDGDFITDEGLINWPLYSRERMRGDLVIPTDGDEESLYNFDITLFPSASEHIRRIIHHHIHPHAQTIFLSSPETIMHKYGEHMMLLPKLLHVPKLTEFENYCTVDNGVFLELLTLYRRGLYQLCFSMSVSYLERAISEILHRAGWVWDSTKHIKFNDLLAAPMARDVFGEEIIFVLKLLVGPTQGMSIRNMVWHGTFSDGGFPIEYASMILMIILSIPLQSNVTLLSLEMFDVPVVVPSVDFSALVEHSYFAPLIQKQMWLDLFQMYTNGEAYYAAVMLFPLLEFNIRRLFVQANNRFDLVDNAETGFVTFEDSLSPHLGFGQGTNLLFNELEDSILHNIHDMLVWVYGPQIRVRISHGIIDPRAVPQSVFDSVMVLVIQLFNKYSCRPVPIQTEYTPRYHPQSKLFASLGETVHCLDRFYKDVVEQWESNQSYGGDTGYVMSVALKDRMVKVLDRTADHIQDHLSRQTMFPIGHIDLDMEHLNEAIIPFVIPYQFSETLGSNITAIEVLRSITDLVQETIRVTTEMIHKATLLLEDKKTIKKGTKHLEKYKANVYPLYMLMVMISRGAELGTIHINQMPFEINKRSLLLLRSIVSCIAKNQWTKSALIDRVLIAFEKQLEEW